MSSAIRKMSACGTSAVFRISALLATEGMATETVREDMLTSFKMAEQGYRTIYLNEPLSIGLAPEGVDAYITQRSRWCLGAIQQIYTRWSFLGAGRVSFVHRLSSFGGALFWTFTFPFKVMMLLTPLVYWWSGTAVINATVDDLLEWLLPSALGGMIYMSFYSHNRVLPIMAAVTQLLPSLVVMDPDTELQIGETMAEVLRKRLGGGNHRSNRRRDRGHRRQTRVCA
jgi:cellulose synthase (UDP-forming)